MDNAPPGGYSFTYFGMELLEQIRTAYLQRSRLATDRGYHSPDSKYYWIYEELMYRLQFLRKTQLFIAAFPEFIRKGAEEDAVGYAVSFASGFFNRENIGEAECEDGQHPFFNDENVYYRDFTEALYHIDTNYDLFNHPLLYIDLTECVVRAARLFLQIRERQFHAIDRDKFDALMQIHEQLPASA